MASTLLTFVYLAGFSIALAAGWNYDDNSANGPSNWPPPCSNGTEQSPIDINTTTAMYDSSLGDFTLVNYGTTPAGVMFTAKNKGKGLEISFDSHVYNVSGGNLPGTFTTVQFHLHWGSSNDKGSEHTVDGMMYPAEVGSNENPDYKKFLDQISYVKNMSGDSRQFSAFPLMSLLPMDMTKYYRYPGSLTTPPCSEAVTWTVFEDPVEISQAQLNQLRMMKYNDTAYIVNNYRPVEMLGSRQVKVSYDMSATTMTTPTTAPAVTTDGVALKISNVVLLLMLLLGVVFFH